MFDYNRYYYTQNDLFVNLDLSGLDDAAEDTHAMLPRTMTREQLQHQRVHNTYTDGAHKNAEQRHKDLFSDHSGHSFFGVNFTALQLPDHWDE